MNYDDTDWLRERMARVRSDLADDVGEVVEQAKELTDWRSYVRRHPWMCAGAAAAIGFMIVPVRRAVVPPSQPASTEANGHCTAMGVMPDKRLASTRTTSALIELAAGIAVRSLVSMAGQQLQNLLVSRAPHDPRTRPERR